MNEVQNSPNCLTDLELSALADGALAGASADRANSHVDLCQACRTRLEKLISLGPTPDSTMLLWSNGSCPSPEEMGAYLDESLPKPQMREMDQHLAGCSWCRHLLAAFHSGQPETQEPQPEMVDLVRGLVPMPAETAAPPMFRERRPASPSRSNFSWFVAGASLAAAATFVAIFLIYGNGGTTEPDASGKTNPSRPAEVRNKDLPVTPGSGAGAAGSPDNTTTSVTPTPGSPDPASGSTGPGETRPPETIEGPGTAPQETDTPRDEPETPTFPEQPAVEDHSPAGPEPGDSGGADVTTSQPGFETSRFQPRILNNDAYGDLGSGLVRVTGPELPLPRFGAPPAAVTFGDNKLLVDADGDGVPETVVSRRKPVASIRVFYEDGRKSRYYARFIQMGDAWYYRSHYCMAGRVCGQSLFLFDENGNGKFDDAGVDRAAFGTAECFTFVSPVMLISGELHDVRVSTGGDRVDFRKFEGETGTIDISSGFRGRAKVSTAIVTDGTIWLNVGGVSGPCPVPSGLYRLLCGVIASQRLNVSFDGPENSPIEVLAGAALAPEWGGPLVVDFTYDAAESEVSLNTSAVVFSGIMGERYYHPNPKVARTKVIVRDAATLRVLADPVLSIPVAGSRVTGASPST